VAPLTTTVMSAVGEEQAGVASGINNAVSRTAGLLAIAVFGVMMLHTFSQTLASRMNELQLDDRVKHTIYEERVKLAAVQVPPDIDSATREQLKAAVAAAFVHGFRVIMFTSAALGIASAASSWVFIRKSRPTRSQQQRN
jgi:hypothetical protein